MLGLRVHREINNHYWLSELPTPIELVTVESWLNSLSGIARHESTIHASETGRKSWQFIQVYAVLEIAFGGYITAKLDL